MFTTGCVGCPGAASLPAATVSGSFGAEKKVREAGGEEVFQEMGNGV